jgi:superfamily II DNA/RNA helicase
MLFRFFLRIFPLSPPSFLHLLPRYFFCIALCLLYLLEQMTQAIVFCRTNLDCDNLETFLSSLNGGQKFRGRQESGKEGKYSCAVLAGMRSMQERRESLSAFREGSVR